MNNIFVLNKNYKKIGTLSNQGANPQAPYYEDLYVQDLETGADTYEFSTMSSKYTQDLLEIGNYIMFSYRGRNELFTITSLEYSHSEGYKTIGVYAEGVGFDLLDVFMERPSIVTDEDRKKSRAFCLDVEGNVIYKTEDGGNIPDEDRDLVSLNDEGGYIVYKPSKNNKKNDTLEFHNISYTTFINILLKGSGWTYICQPGLENIKYDITVKYDTNVYAILQDSMQAYRGVELEFVHEYNNGSITKIIKAYKDGGRGSFVGKRFEYGTNVRGIIKTQEVANSEDDTVLRIDNVGIDITYDVDFALKSVEVPEIEIGDTHYVIDRDFYPPMTIKARIGKIEISFSDPTVNKIYLANNKKISGSAIEDEFNEDDIKDIIDDYDDPEDPVDPSDPGSGEDPDDPDNPSTPMVPAASSDNLIKAPRMHAYEFLLYTNKDGDPNFSTHSRTTDYAVLDSPINEGEHPTSEDIYNFLINDTKVYDVSYRVLDYLESKAQGGSANDPSNYCLRITPDVSTDYALCKDHSATDYMGECTMSLAGSRIFSDIIDPSTDRPDFEDGLTLIGDGNSNISNDHHDKHMLDVGSLACGLLAAFQYHIKKAHGGSSGSSGGTDSGNGSTSADTTFENLHINKWLTMGSETAPQGASTAIKMVDSRDELSIYPSGINTTGGIMCNDVIAKDLSASRDLDAERIRVYGGGLHIFNKVVFPDGSYIDVNGPGKGEPPSGGNPPTDPDTGGGDDDSGNNGGNSGNYATVEYVDEQLTANMDIIEMNYLSKAEAINDYATIEYVNSKLGGGTGSGGGSISGIPDGIFEYIQTDTSAQFYGSSWLDINSTVHVADNNLIVDGSLVVFGALEQIDYLYAKEADITTLRVNGVNITSDKSLKENIRYIDAASANDLEKADLHDFIVNQLNICEYNYIGDTADKIGLIANDYEGTKVGDKIVTRNEKTDLLAYDSNNLLFATIGALQEEVRTRDEKIATLEDRLARLEALLGIDN